MTATVERIWTRLLPLLHRIPPIPWLLLTLAAACLGLRRPSGLLDQYSCGLTVPANAPLPGWIYTVIFIVLCAGRASVWLPMLASALLLKLPSRRGVQIAVFATLFVALTTVLALGHSYAYVSAYGGSWANKALEEAPISAQYSFWITLATAAVTLGTHRLTQRRA